MGNAWRGDILWPTQVRKNSQPRTFLERTYTNPRWSRLRPRRGDIACSKTQLVQQFVCMETQRFEGGQSRDLSTHNPNQVGIKTSETPILHIQWYFCKENQSIVR